MQSRERPSAVADFDVYAAKLIATPHQARPPVERTRRDWA